MRNEPLLPFPLELRRDGDGLKSEEYVIPAESKAKVLEQMYPFEGVPSLDDRRHDIHVEKDFVVRDFKVVREEGVNYLVSPYYYEGGGTVADWFPVDDDEDLSDA